jgi:hypothetical protein
MVVGEHGIQTFKVVIVVLLLLLLPIDYFISTNATMLIIFGPMVI